MPLLPPCSNNLYNISYLEQCKTTLHKTCIQTQGLLGTDPHIQRVCAQERTPICQIMFGPPTQARQAAIPPEPRQPKQRSRKNVVMQMSSDVQALATKKSLRLLRSQRPGK